MLEFSKKGYKLGVLKSLEQEVKSGFIRANHQFEFNCQLPFNKSL